MKILLIGCFIVLSFFSNAQGVEFQWAKSLGTTVGIKDTELDSIGNIYVTGVFNGIVDFDPSAANTYTLNGAADIFLSKFDNLGNFIWAKSFGGRGMDSGNSLTIDMFGNVYMTGCFQDTVILIPLQL